MHVNVNDSLLSYVNLSFFMIYHNNDETEKFHVLYFLYQLYVFSSLQFLGEGLGNPNKFSELLETSEPERTFKKKVADNTLYSRAISN